MPDFVLPIFIRKPNKHLDDLYFEESFQRRQWERVVENQEFPVRKWVINRLRTGFARPNGDMAWTILFSDISEEDRVKLIDTAEKNEFENYHDINSTPYYDYGQDGALVLAMRRFVGFFEKYWDLDSLDISMLDAARLRSISIVNCGWGLSRDYSPAANACITVLRMQETEIVPLVEPSDVTVLRDNMHHYIDTLVRLNNEVQRYCSYARGHTTLPEIEFIHSIKWTDSEITEIAHCALAKLFCSAVKYPDALNPQMTLANAHLCLV